MSQTPQESKPVWDRSQKWRQGSLISANDCLRLDIFSEEQEGYLAMVISHDCDCVSDIDIDPEIEIVAANISTKVLPNHMHAKNPRQLQLASKETGISIDLDGRKKKTLPKAILGKLAPDTLINLSKSEKRILARWLACRYDRFALPDELQRRLRVVEDTIESAGKADPTGILGVYLYHEQDDELPQEEVYFVDIRIVYDGENPTAEQAAHNAATTIEARFTRKFYTGDNGIRPTWKGVELEHCSAVSDVQFSLSDLMTYKLWRLEHISLRQDPVAETPTFR